MCGNIEQLLSMSKTIFISPMGNQILASHLSRNKKKYSSKIEGRGNSKTLKCIFNTNRIVSQNIKYMNEVPYEISRERKICHQYQATVPSNMSGCSLNGLGPVQMQNYMEGKRL